MTFAFALEAQTREGLIEKIYVELDRVVQMHPEHATELEEAKHFASRVVKKLQLADPWEEYAARVSGSVTQQVLTDNDRTGVTWVNFNFSAGVVRRTP